MADLRPRFKPRDLVAEALASLTARPGRAVLTALGTVMGVAALVATLGLSKTAGNQIVGRFDALAATDIVVTPKAAAAGRVSAGSGLPWDAEARAARLNGVVAAGTLPGRGRDPHRRRRTHRRPAAAGPQPHRHRSAEGDRPARTPPGAGRRPERPEHPLPPPGRRLAVHRGGGDRQRHPGLGPGAG